MRNKYIYLIILTFLFLLSDKVYADSQFDVTIDGKDVSVKMVNVEVNKTKLDMAFNAYTDKGRTFVPIRELTESLGADVEWDNSTKSASISLGQKEIKLKIGSNIIYINGVKTKLEENSIPKFAEYKEPRIETKTMVPLRFLSEAFGYDVDWNGETKTASVLSSKKETSKAQKEETKSKDKEKIKTASLNNTDKGVKSLNGNNALFTSNYEKMETNQLNKTAEEEAYKAAGLSIPDLEEEERVITKRFKIDGPLTIVIDPGHGGKDSGAIMESGLTEKELNLKVAGRLYELLKKEEGYEVIITRTEDEFIKLVDRAAISNDNGAEIFLSIHFNSSDNKEAKGIEVLYASESKVKIKTVEQKHFANELLKALIEETGCSSRGLKNRPDLVVLNKTKNVSALAELGFMSNEEDYKNIVDDNYLDKLANGLFKGIKNYVNKYGDK
ncbi:N-acetylmuramoyl-L-alanine amidase [Peptoniphilus sp. oral taxon 386]|uniref:N-acetylmuramoyl-L-alanine amidase n=1 Tax=Peptoniphilus sp. oral taxon 386 TaxID=652713 RepID=UPI0001DA9BB7|nr:N-acetylmuramoyl-L-alanine amidase [Peptoniphilus sp. oral taxon 386]EFI42361.1 N-acetylmuramoyl-L-alanine amidase [Peptoniphilus sp. oral taxon 386 str. F0131]